MYEEVYKVGSVMFAELVSTTKVIDTESSISFFFCSEHDGPDFVCVPRITFRNWGRSDKVIVRRARKLTQQAAAWTVPRLQLAVASLKSACFLVKLLRIRSGQS